MFLRRHDIAGVSMFPRKLTNHGKSVLARFGFRIFQRRDYCGVYSCESTRTGCLYQQCGRVVGCQQIRNFSGHSHSWRDDFFPTLDSYARSGAAVGRAAAAGGGDIRRAVWTVTTSPRSARSSARAARKAGSPRHGGVPASWCE